ncbi:MAG TPA: 4-oxalocrotonate tautomerase [Limnochordales bacterium]
MPIVHVYLLEGRPPERIRALVEEVTRAVVKSLQVSPERVRVLVSEVPRTHWAVGGVPMSEPGDSSAGAPPAPPAGASRPAQGSEPGRSREQG